MAQTPVHEGNPEWERLSREMRVVELTPLLMVLVPPLAVLSASRSTRGLTLLPGKAGMGVGASLVASALALGYLLAGTTGPLGALASLWFLGTVGVATLVSARRPIAFVKRICVGCRLLPIIKEHEAIHLSGVADEGRVWASMKTRHSTQSLALEGDPSVCSFCPIPKRLKEVEAA